MVNGNKPKFRKHPAKMTSDELAEGVFHPKLLAAVRKHLDSQDVASDVKKPPKSSK
jgi:hypothetical protein